MIGYKKMLIIFASIVVIAVLLIISRVPLILATYAGTHSVEASTGNLDCLLCHKYIENEFNHSPQTLIVFEKHKAAAGNANYTTFIKYGYKYNSSEERIYTSSNNSTWDKGANADSTTYLQWYAAAGWIDNRTGEYKNVTLSLDVNGIAGIQNEEMCLLCHKSDMYDVEAHGVTIIGCTDIKCHGNADREAMPIPSTPQERPGLFLLRTMCIQNGSGYQGTVLNFSIMQRITVQWLVMIF